MSGSESPHPQQRVPAAPDEFLCKHCGRTWPAGTWPSRQSFGGNHVRFCGAKGASAAAAAFAAALGPVVARGLRGADPAPRPSVVPGPGHPQQPCSRLRVRVGYWCETCATTWEVRQAGQWASHRDDCAAVHAAAARRASEPVLSRAERWEVATRPLALRRRTARAESTDATHGAALQSQPAPPEHQIDEDNNWVWINLEGEQTSSSAQALPTAPAPTAGSGQAQAQGQQAAAAASEREAATAQRTPAGGHSGYTILFVRKDAEGRIELLVRREGEQDGAADWVPAEVVHRGCEVCRYYERHIGAIRTKAARAPQPNSAQQTPAPPTGDPSAPTRPGVHPPGPAVLR
eukprot:m51a1_g5392 hypothetical protein (347) ;mRNA; r:37725-39506